MFGRTMVDTPVRNSLCERIDDSTGTTSTRIEPSPRTRGVTAMRKPTRMCSNSVDSTLLPLLSPSTRSVLAMKLISSPSPRKVVMPLTTVNTGSLRTVTSPWAASWLTIAPRVQRPNSSAASTSQAPFGMPRDRPEGARRARRTRSSALRYSRLRSSPALSPASRVTSRIATASSTCRAPRRICSLSQASSCSMRAAGPRARSRPSRRSATSQDRPPSGAGAAAPPSGDGRARSRTGRASAGAAAVSSRRRMVRAFASRSSQGESLWS